MSTRGSRSEKVNRIFQKFDANQDGGLNRDEMAALVVAVNPRVKFSDEQINAILDEVFRTYGNFIQGDEGLTFEGLLRTYDDGAGDVDRDFDALELDINNKGILVTSEASSSSIADERALESQKKQRTAAWALSPNHGIVFDDSWKIVDDLEILIKRLKAKQAKDGKLKADNLDAHSDAGWSRELGPSSEISEKRVFWEESGHDYVSFLKELEALRTRADRARSRDEAFDGHMVIGRVLYEHQLFKEALVSFNRACELLPTDVKPHFRAGNCFYVLGKYKEAKDEFLLAVEAAEAGGNQWGYLLPQIYVNLGIALEGEGMVLSACEYYREAAILCPTHFRALKLLGSALFGRASEMYTRVLAVWPNHWRAQLNKAVSLLGAGETEDETFQGAVKGVNERILSVLDESGSGRVDLGLFFAVLAPICNGPPEKRKRVAYDALVWRHVNEGGTQIRKLDAVKYIKLLRTIYVPIEGSSEIVEVHGHTDNSIVSFTEFLVMFDDPDRGFGIMSTMLKLETGDRNRHGNHVCSVCRYPIIGSRFKEMKSHFSLCNQCYSEGKVPPSCKQEAYRFKEYGSEGEAVKDKCFCFTMQSHDDS
ncbi:putative TPR repeat-containing protein, partial [Cucurbita argyrosperma subsp. sororia]